MNLLCTSVSQMFFQETHISKTKRFKAQFPDVFFLTLVIFLIGLRFVKLGFFFFFVYSWHSAILAITNFQKVTVFEFEPPQISFAFLKWLSLMFLFLFMLSQIKSTIHDPLLGPDLMFGNQSSVQCVTLSASSLALIHSCSLSFGDLFAALSFFQIMQIKEHRNPIRVPRQK